jgi:PAS domain S-box-containing protein
MIFVKDYDSRFVLANPMVARMYNTTVENLIGRTDADFNRSLQKVEDLLAADRQVIESGEPLFIEESITNLSGETRWIQTTKVPIISPDGKAKRVLGVSTDITERRQAEEVLRQALTKEKELGDLKTRFVSMASHEFRTPLATILALVETLSAYRHKLPEEQIDERFDKIKDQVGHLKDIMEDVLLLARMQARRVEFNPVKVDLDALARSVLDEFASRPDVKHRLEYTIGESNQEVMLDRKLMRQIISNLVSNAIKYSPEGRVVRIGLQYADGELILKISDEGIGIPEADLPHLFEPFHRAANVGTISGTGLGLVITKEATELHGGTITVESQQGAGTTFIIRIPISAGGGQKNDDNTGH